MTEDNAVKIAYCLTLDTSVCNVLQCLCLDTPSASPYYWFLSRLARHMYKPQHFIISHLLFDDWKSECRSNYLALENVAIFNKVRKRE